MTGDVRGVGGVGNTRTLRDQAREAARATRAYKAGAAFDVPARRADQWREQAGMFTIAGQVLR